MESKSSILIPFRDNPRELTTVKSYISTGLMVKNNLRDKETVFESKYRALRGYHGSDYSLYRAPAKRSVTSIKSQWLIIWGMHYWYQGGCDIGNDNYTYVIYDKFAHFTLRYPHICLVWGILLYIFPMQDLFCQWILIISMFVLIKFCTIQRCMYWYSCVCYTT